MKIILTLLLLIQPLFAAENTVRIYKQWHLLAKIQTNDIEKSKRLGQYKNQKFIYQSLDKLIQEKKVRAVISEGCQGEINEKFNRTYNTWNYNKLKAYVAKPEYIDILTLAPLKLEVKHTKNLATICGDNEDLLLKHGFAFSDLNGFAGYYTRLAQHKGKNQKKYDLYVKSMLSDVAENVKDPVAYAKKKANKALEDVIKYIGQRNDFFVEAIEKNIKKNPALVIGGIHIKDLVQKLKKKKIKYQVMKVEGYPEGSEKILDKLKKLLK